MPETGDRLTAALADRYRIEREVGQAPTENLGHHVRIIPGWVKQMKQAADAANR